MSIFFVDGPGGSGSVDLGQDVIFPVCSPAIAARFRTPQDLAKATFLHDSTWSGDWNGWLNETLPGEPFDTRGPVFSLYSLAVAGSRAACPPRAAGHGGGTAASAIRR
jgi:LysR family glycine cleavage system transcriptional activator